MVNKAEKILLVGSGLWYLGEGMLGPLFTIFAQNIGGDILEISWAWATYLLVMGVLNIILGKYSDHWNKEKVMVWGYGLNAVFTFGYLFVSSPFHLFFVQAGLGVATALATPTWDALYAKHEDRKKDGSAWGLAAGIPDIVIGIAIILGGLVINYFSFTLLFIIMGIIQVIATVYQAQILYCKQKEKVRNNRH